MKGLGVAAVLVLVVALAGAALWVATREPEIVVENVVTRTVVEVVPGKPTPDRPGRTRPSGGNRWTSRGEGSVVGVLREYGTDRALGGVEVALVAGSPGPDRTIEATTRPDGTFAMGGVEAFDGWTLRAKAPKPLADAEISSIAVAVGRETDVGVVYLAPAFAVPGIVVDERGAPVEGVDVLAARWRAAAARIDVVRMLREIGDRPATVDRAVSGKDGRFRLTRLVPGTYDVATQRAGFVHRVEAAVIVTPASAARELKLVVRKGHAIEGRVVRKDAGPVAGVAVVALPEPRGARFIDPLTKSFATTDAEGLFRLDGLGSGRHVVAVTPEGEPISVQDRVQVPTAARVEIVLEGDATLEGRVTAPDDRPVAGAHVLVLSEKMKSFASAATDADGRYAMRGLRSGGEVAFVVTAEGHPPHPADLMSMMSGRNLDLTLLPGANRRDVKLAAGTVVRGTVRDVATGAGVAGARVELGAGNGLFGGLGESGGATTGADGNYEIRGVAAGRHGVGVTKPGWFPAGGAPASARMPDVLESGFAEEPSVAMPMLEIPEGAQEFVHDVSIARAGAIRGLVTAPDGSAVAGARVAIEGASPSGDFPTPALPGVDLEPRLTGDDGTFVLPSPPPGLKIRVAAHAPGFAPGRSDPVTSRGTEDVADVAVRLRNAATLEGRVTDAEGKAVEGAEVRWATRSLRDAPSTTTDAEGRFRAEGVEPATFVVQATHPRYLPWSAKDQVAAEGGTLTIDAVLTLGAVVTGTVLAPDGKPAAGATVDLRMKGRPTGLVLAGSTDLRAPVVSGGDGSFRAEGLAPGTYTAQARLEGFVTSDPLEVAAPGDGVTLRLAEAFPIAGVVRHRGGAPIPGIDVVARSEKPDGSRGGRVASARSGADGRFEMKGLAAGSYQVRAEADGSGRTRPNVLPATVAGVAAGRTDVVVEMDPGFVISGTVFRSDGAPAAKGRVSCERQRPRGTPRADGDRGNAAIADGKFEVVALAPGTYDVSVGVDDHAPKRIAVEAGATAVRIDMTAGGGIRGRVLLADGAPAVGAHVNAGSPLGNGSARTDAQGRYEISHLAEGPAYNVVASIAAAAQSQRGGLPAVAVREGAVTDAADITLAPAPTAKAPAPPMAPK